MELPPRLRAAIDGMLEGVPLSALQAASANLSQRYRSEVRDGRLHLSDALAIKAYLAARMPATYAAIRTSFAMLDDALPGFSPLSLLDAGAGPGTVLWAATDCWPSLERAEMLDASSEAANMGRTLSRDLPGIESRWSEGDATLALETAPAVDLVTLAYVLDELPPQAIPGLVVRLWRAAKQVLVIVEPGTPAGWHRILQSRDILLGEGAHIAAPCAHEKPCPLKAPDWCHFSRRVARARMHRLAKGGEAPWEDEKFIFLAATRTATAPRSARVIAPPRQGKGRIDLKLCAPDGQTDYRTVSKRQNETFRIARRVEWGDAVDEF
ncbi:MAG: methyltransferase type 11 [Rhizobiaceae bacterium]|nr:methyltransferase type 11 [Rhizobiaceae bacterium]